MGQRQLGVNETEDVLVLVPEQGCGVSHSHLPVGKIWRHKDSLRGLSLPTLSPYPVNLRHLGLGLLFLLGPQTEPRLHLAVQIPQDPSLVRLRLLLGRIVHTSCGLHSRGTGNCY